MGALKQGSCGYGLQGDTTDELACFELRVYVVKPSNDLGMGVSKIGGPCLGSPIMKITVDRGLHRG